MKTHLRTLKKLNTMHHWCSTSSCFIISSNDFVTSSGYNANSSYGFVNLQYCWGNPAGYVLVCTGCGTTLRNTRRAIPIPVLIYQPCVQLCQTWVQTYTWVYNPNRLSYLPTNSLYKYTYNKGCCSVMPVPVDLHCHSPPFYNV